MVFGIRPSGIAKIAMIFGLALSLSSCGVFEKKKDKKKDDPQPTITISGKEKSGDNAYVVQFVSNISGATFLCRVETKDGSGSWDDCSGGSITIEMKEFAITLYVKAVVGGRESNTDTARIPGLNDDNNQNLTEQGGDESAEEVDKSEYEALPPYRGGMTFTDITLVGRSVSWRFRIPPHFHLLTAAVESAPFGGIDFIQIMKGADPFYFGYYPKEFLSLDGCGVVGRHQVGITSPSGLTLGYCMDNIRKDSPEDIDYLLKKFYGTSATGLFPKFTQNHVQIGSDVGQNYKNLVFQIYDVPRDKVDNVIYKTCTETYNHSNKVFQKEPWVESFFSYGGLELGSAATCVIEGAGVSSGLWQVASLIYTSKAPGDTVEMVELTYFEHRPNRLHLTADDFVRNLTEFVYDNKIITQASAYTY